MKKSIIAIVILFMLGLSACGVSKSGEYFEGDYVIDVEPMDDFYYTKIVLFSDGMAYIKTESQRDYYLTCTYSYSKDLGLIAFDISTNKNSGRVAKISNDLKTITFDGYTLTRK